jgi:hypothetical protein
MGPVRLAVNAGVGLMILRFFLPWHSASGKLLHYLNGLIAIVFQQIIRHS